VERRVCRIECDEGDEYPVERYLEFPGRTQLSLNDVFFKKTQNVFENFADISTAVA